MLAMRSSCLRRLLDGIADASNLAVAFMHLALHVREGLLVDDSIGAHEKTALGRFVALVERGGIDGSGLSHRRLILRSSGTGDGEDAGIARATGEDAALGIVTRS